MTYEPTGNTNANNRVSQTISTNTGNNVFFGRSYTMTNLAQAQSYNIYITAANEFGSSPASQSFTCQTQGVAPAAPIGSCGISSSNSLTVSWVDGVNTGGSAINSYTVTYEPVGNVNANNRVSQTISTNTSEDHR